MTRIVTTTYRYKPPPKRKGRKLAEITGPAVVTSVDPKKAAAARFGLNGGQGGTVHPLLRRAYAVEHKSAGPGQR